MSQLRHILPGVLLPPFVACTTAAASPGEIDPSFDVGIGSTGPIRAVATDDRNRLVVAGGFTSFDGTPAGRIVRLLEDGSVDTTFNAGAGANADIKAIEILPDRRILVGGQFTSFGDTSTRGLVLLHPDGTVDDTFTSGFSADGFSVGVTCLEAIPGGKIMVGGYFTKYAGQSVGRYAMITTSGALSGPTPQPAGADSHVFDIDLLPNGKMLICGFFTTVDGHASACVARLLSSGSVDTGFGTGTNLGTVAYSVEGLADGKVIIGGSFSNYFGFGQRFLGRLTPTGSPDATYAGNTGPDLNVYGLTLDAQERLIVAGQFKHFHDAAMPGIGRLLPDGSRDDTFAFGRPTSASFIQEYPIDNRGRILAYGWANYLAKPAETTLIRLIGEDLPPRESWLLQHFGTTSPTGEAAWDAIPAGDGITTLQKYALGFQGDPRQRAELWGDDGLIHGFWNDGTTSGFRFRTDLSRTDAIATAEWSTALGVWTSEGLQVAEESREGSVVTWKVTLPGTHPRAFFRMNTGLDE